MTTNTMDSIGITDKASPRMTDEERWAALRSRDKAADGVFYYSVRTTGVYCRPSCSSRPARPENVAFHATREEAEKAGFRPCRRCHPDQPGLDALRADAIARACRLIERAEEEPTLQELASAVGMSRFHFHHVFKEVTGVTPRAYAAARRAERVRRGLTAGGTVTEAVYEAGFNSSGRFYAGSNALLGMTPTAFRSGAPGLTIRFAVGRCSLGSVLVASTDLGICSIMLGDDPEALVSELQRRFGRAELIGGDEEYERLVARVVGFVEAPGRGLDLPLDVRGTAFQQRVWQALREIPTGSTATYGDIARRLGSPGAQRAVAGACANNPIAVAIPCHRVVRKDGDASGYRWGVERKRELLRREGAA